MKIQLSEHFTYKKLIKFTIPTIIMMIFTSIYGIVDGIFVSNCVGSDALASINLIMPVLMMTSAVGFMIGTGGSAIVSKTLGEGNKEKANQYFSMLIYFVIIIGIILSIIGFIFMRPISEKLGAQGEVLEGCVLYGRISIIGIVAFMLQIAFQSFMIVAEKPNIELMITIGAGITNIIVDFLLIYILKWGLTGAAIATVLSECIGAFVPLIYFINKKNKSTIHLTKTKFYGKVLLKSCTNGSSEMLTHISASLVNMLYNMQLMKLVGSNGVVAYGIIMYVSFVFSATYIGYSIGTAPIVGYHYGAKDTAELKNILKKSAIILLIVALSMTLISEILSGTLASIFVSYDNTLLELTTNAIRIFALAFLFSGFNMFTSSFFTALNNGLISAIMSFSRTVVFQVSMIFILPIWFGINGIWLSIVVAEILSLIVAVSLLFANSKKYQYA